MRKTSTARPSGSRSGNFAIDPLSQVVFLLDRQGCVVTADTSMAGSGFAKVAPRRGASVHRCLHPACADSTCPLLLLFAEGLQRVAKVAVQEWEYPEATGNRTLRLHMRRRFGGDGDGYAVLTVVDISTGRNLSRLLKSTNESLAGMLRSNDLERTGELRRLNHSLRNLSGELIVAQESERRRIAAELHDSLGQWLSLAKMSVETASEHTRDPAVMAPLGKAFEHIKTAISEVRNIVNNLRPSMLEEFGLVATLELLCHELQASQPAMEVRCAINDGDARLSTPMCVTMVRILQEALNNVAKHSRASAVKVVIKLDPAEASLLVADNGRGFDVHAVPGHGFGIGSLRQRAERSGGRLTLASAAGEGTRLQVVWDLDPGDDTSLSGTHKAIRYGVGRDGRGVAES